MYDNIIITLSLVSFWIFGSVYYDVKGQKTKPFLFFPCRWLPINGYPLLLLYGERCTWYLECQFGEGR